MRLGLAIILLLATAARGAAQGVTTSAAQATQDLASPSGVRHMIAPRLAGAAPVIDGRLDDAAWSGAAVATDFVQMRPHPGEAASLPTEVRILYAGDAIYVAARMYDPHPDSIIAQLTRRDDMGVSDKLELGLDSYHDRRTAFAFGLTPRGVKEDVFLFDDTQADDNWDAVWQGAARIDSLGWTAEFRIPLSQLRFNVGAGVGGGKQAWGVQFKRTVGRSNEESYWVLPPTDNSRNVSAFGELAGLEGLSAPRRLELMPYSLSKLTRQRPDDADPFAHRAAYAGNLGADLKYGLGSSLTLTTTLNPDFGQVEADPSVVNLSAFESFFPEKRPFFLEGADIFRFGVGLGDGSLGSESLFYSRRIGRSPQLGAPDGADYSDVPSAAPILGAAKLSGKTAGGWSIGVLDAVTGRESARYVSGNGPIESAPVEPLSNYGVARVIHSSADGQNALGAIVTATDRRLDAPRLQEQLASAAYVGGLNFRQRFHRGTYEATGWVVGSQILGSDSAIAQRQRDATHAFQRPGAAHLTYDPSRTGMGGWAGSVSFSKIRGAWQWGLIENVRSPGFDANDLGYQQNADMAIHVLYSNWRTLKPWHEFRRIGLNSDVYFANSFGWERVARGIEGNVNTELQNNWGGGAYVGHDYWTVSPAELRGGPALRVPGNTRVNVFAYSDSRKRIGANVSGFYRRMQENAGTELDLNPSIWLRPSSQIDVQLGPGFTRNTSTWQYVTTEDDAGGASHYVFADLRQTTVAMTARINYTFSPTVSFQLYAQPFTSAGTYSGFKEATATLAPSMADRFRVYRTTGTPEIAFVADDDVYRVGGASGFTFDRPDFGVRQYRSNAVLRWEWRPGSTVYVVWSQERAANDSDGRYRFGPDVHAMFNGDIRNVLLIKASYWLGR